MTSRKDAGNEKVFPVKRYSDYGYYPSIRLWLNGWLSAIKVKTATKTPYSFRHTWRTAAFQAIVNQDIVRVIGGWAVPGGEQVTTYLHKHSLSFRDMKRELDKVDLSLTFQVFVHRRFRSASIFRNTLSCVTKSNLWYFCVLS